MSLLTAGVFLSATACAPKAKTNPVAMVPPIDEPTTVEAEPEPEPKGPPPLLYQLAHREGGLSVLQATPTTVVAIGGSQSVILGAKAKTFSGADAPYIPVAEEEEYGPASTASIIGFAKPASPTVAPEAILLVEESQYERSGPTYTVWQQTTGKWERVANDKGGLEWIPVAASPWGEGTLALVTWSIPNGDYDYEYGYGDDSKYERAYRKRVKKLKSAKPELRWFGRGAAPPFPNLPDLRPKVADKDFDPWDSTGTPRLMVTTPAGAVAVAYGYAEHARVAYAAPGSAEFTLLPPLTAGGQPVEIRQLAADGDAIVVVGASVGEEGTRPLVAYVHDAKRVEPVELPGALDEGRPYVRSFARQGDGTTWAILTDSDSDWDLGDTQLWRKPSGGEWTAVELQPIAVPEAAKARWSRVGHGEWIREEPTDPAAANDELTPTKLLRVGDEVLVVVSATDTDFNSHVVDAVFTTHPTKQPSMALARSMMSGISSNVHLERKAVGADCGEVFLELAPGEEIDKPRIEHLASALATVGIDRPIYKVRHGGAAAIGVTASGWDYEWDSISTELKAELGTALPLFCGAPEVYDEILVEAHAE